MKSLIDLMASIETVSTDPAIRARAAELRRRFELRQLINDVICSAFSLPADHFAGRA